MKSIFVTMFFRLTIVDSWSEAKYVYKMCEVIKYNLFFAAFKFLQSFCFVCFAKLLKQINASLKKKNGDWW